LLDGSKETPMFLDPDSRRRALPSIIDGVKAPQFILSRGVFRGDASSPPPSGQGGRS